MSVGEPQPLPRQAIDVRRSDPRRTVTADIAIPQVVGIDKHNIRHVGGGSRTSGQDRHEGEQSCHTGGSKRHSVGPVIVNKCKGDGAWSGIPSWADRPVRARSRSMLAHGSATPASFTSPISPDRQVLPWPTQRPSMLLAESAGEEAILVRLSRRKSMRRMSQAQSSTGRIH